MLDERFDDRLIPKFAPLVDGWAKERTSVHIRPIDRRAAHHAAAQRVADMTLRSKSASVRLRDAITPGVDHALFPAAVPDHAWVGNTLSGLLGSRFMRRFLAQP